MDNSVLEKRGVRQIDALGRVVIPIDVRRSLDMKIGDNVEFFVDYSQNSVTIRKYVSSCTFCGSQKKLRIFDNKSVCKECIKKLSDIG